MSGFRKEAGLIGIGVATAVAGFFAVGIHSAEQYQEALTQVQVNANLTDDAAKNMGDAIAQAALGTTASSTQMVQALGPVAGELQKVVGHTLTAADAAQTLEAAQSLAAGTGANLQASVKGITDLLLVYHLKASDAASVADNLFRAHTQLGIGTERLAMMLQRLQPRIAGSGVDMEHLLAIVAQVTPVVGSGTRALMQVGGVLGSLANPTQKFQDLMGSLGVHLLDASGKFVGFENVIGQLHDVYAALPATVADSAKATKLQADITQLATDKTLPHTKALTARMNALKAEIIALKANGAEFTQANVMQMLFGRNAAMMTALVSGGTQALDAQVGAFESQMTAQQAAIKQDATLGGQMKILHGYISSVSTIIGMALVPGLQALNSWLLPIVDTVARWIAANPHLTTAILAAAGAIGAMVAALAVGVPIMKQVRLGIEFLGGPVLVVVGAFLLLSRALTGIPGLMKPLQAIFDAFGHAAAVIGPALGALVGAISDLVAGRGSVEAVSRAFGDLGTAIMQAAGAVLGALGDLAHKIVDWAVSMLPVWGGLLAQWAGEFTKWLGGIIDWIVQNGPAIARALLDWATAFVNWIAPMAGQVLGGLLLFLGGVVEWIGRSIPVIANALVGWANALIDWVVNVAAPGVLGALGRMVDNVTSWISGSGAIAKITDALVSWTTAFVNWVGPVALQVVGGLVAGLAVAIVTKGPEIAGAVISGGAQILGGLVKGIIAHPEVLVNGIATLFALGAIVRAISLAGAAAGAIYSVATDLGGALGTVLELAWKGVAGAAKFAIAAAGAAAGALYAGAMAVARIIIDALGDAWEEVTTDVGVEAAVGIAGGGAGAIYAGADGVVATVGKGLKRAIMAAWEMIAGDPEVNAITAGAGAANTLSYDAGSAATGLLGRVRNLLPKKAVAAEAEQLTLGLLPEAPMKGEQLTLGLVNDGLMATALAKLSGFAGRLKLAWNNVWKVVADSTADIRSVFGKVASDFFGALKDLFMTPITKLGGILKGAFGSLGEVITTILGGVIEGTPIEGLVARLSTWIGGIFAGGLTGVLGSLADIILGPIGLIIGGIVLAITNPRFFGQILGALVELITHVLGAIGGALGNLFQFASDLGGKFGDFLIQAWNGGVPFLLNTIGGFFHDLPGHIADGLRGAFSGVADWWSQVTGGAAEGANAVDKALGDGTGEWVSTVQSGTAQVTTVIASAVDDWAAEAASGAGKAVDDAALAMEPLTGKLADELAAGAPRVDAGAQTMLRPINRNIDEVGSQIIPGVRTIPPAVAEALNTPDPVRAASMNLFGPIPKAMKDAHDATVAAANKTPGAVANAIKTGEGNIQSALADMAAALKKEAKIAADQVKITTDNMILASAAATKAQKAAALADLKSMNADIQKQTGVDPTWVSKQFTVLAQAMEQAQANRIAAQATGNTALIAKAQEGVDSIDTTWGQLVALAEQLGVKVPTTWQAALDGVKPKPVPAVTSVHDQMSNVALNDARHFGEATVSNYTSGLTGDSSKPKVAPVDNARAKMLDVMDNAHGWGYRAVTNYAQGVTDGSTSLAAAASIAAAALSNHLRVLSPAKMGPLSKGGGPEGWGERFGQLYAKGITGTLDGVADQMAAAFGNPFGAAPGGRPTIGGPTPGDRGFGAAVAAAAGRGDITVKVYLDGKEVSGTVSKIMFDEERRHAGPAVAGSPF